MLQDKDLDKLFQNRFKDFEIEPSEGLFDKIAGELDGKKKKKTFFVWWMAAASVVLVLGVGLFFACHPNGKTSQKIVRLKPAVKPSVKDEKLPVEKVAVANESVENQEAIKDKSASNKANVPKQSFIASAKQKPLKKDYEKPTLPARPDSQRVVERETLVAKSETRKISPETQNVSKPEIEAPEIKKEEPVLASLLKEDADDSAQTDKSKRKIRSMGDIINFVVSKVDKRQEKLIHFSNNDEGTELTGVNLGFVKFKSKNKN
ncbi:hypothetical protein GS399_07205 [Pedobacter sp. HMF7647]|uniref:Uncharacterized protein n=1 Tax=Hufsiella arboris TaxID=2695275 RepID=A0A7K1Y850_9SPHI|nr:DUF3379 domain-containing protein [Hufsiella arboris]MXV50756.1 hypothetical protein [Hufsiella arboris]